jgi:broad specificity phosphatase PhoE
MTNRLVYLVRHAETNWQLVNDRHLVGAANDLAPLTGEGVRQVEALVDRLRGLAPALVLSSPMARALQTAALLSRALDLPLHVEFDLREWVPDLTYSWSSFDQVVDSLEDLRRCGGEWPAAGPQPVWEPLSAVRKRSLEVLSRYVPSRGVVAAVTHGGVIESLTGQIAQLCDVVPYEVPVPPPSNEGD